jgi:hypothetical protein
MDSVKYKPIVVLIELNPFKHKSGSVRAEIPPSNQRTKPGSKTQASFRCEPHTETQATERLYKDAPPSALTNILIV